MRSYWKTGSMTRIHWLHWAETTELRVVLGFFLTLIYFLSSHSLLSPTLFFCFNLHLWFFSFRVINESSKHSINDTLMLYFAVFLTSAVAISIASLQGSDTLGYRWIDFWATALYPKYFVNLMQQPFILYKVCVVKLLSKVVGLPMWTDELLW